MMQSEDLMKLPNVSFISRVQEELQNYPDITHEVRSQIRELMCKVVPMYPQWQFKVSEGRIRVKADQTKYLDIEQFRVYHDGEALGEISAHYHRRKWTMAISCRRARAQLERGDTIHTTDLAKAVSLIKKLFVKQTVNERLVEASSKADQFISQATWQISQKAKNEYDKVAPAMLEFVLTSGFDAFNSYITAHPQWTAAKTALDKYVEFTREQDIVKDISKRYREGKTCLTLLGDGKYVVQRKELSPEVFDDTTLPDEMRGKLGLLKLAVNGQVVDGVGCRVNESVFVIVDEGDSNA
jgi:hypothetical protein